MFKKSLKIPKKKIETIYRREEIKIYQLLFYESRGKKIIKRSRKI